MSEEKKIKYICSVCHRGHTHLYSVDDELYCGECLAKEFYVVSINDEDKKESNS